MYELVNRLLHQADLALAKTMDKTMSHGLLHHFRRIPEMRLEEIARESYVSPATLSRFCNKVDHHNYSTLSQVAKEEMDFFDGQAKEFIHTLQWTDIDAEVVVQYTLDDLVSGLVALKDSIDTGVITQIARLLLSSTMSSLLLQKAHRANVVDFQMNMTLLGKTVFCTNTEDPDISPHHPKNKILVILPTSIDHFIEDTLTRPIQRLLRTLKEEHDVFTVYITMHPEQYILKEREFVVTLPRIQEKLPYPTLVGKQMLEAVLNMIYYSCFYLMVSGKGQ